MENIKYKNELIVKSNYLVESSYKLTVSEFRILYMIISKIQKNDTDFTSYSFTIKDFIDKIGLSGNSSYSDLKKSVRLLKSRTFIVKYIDNDNNKCELITGWISSAQLINKTTIEFSLDPKLKPFLLELKKNFTKLPIERLMQLSSIYSYRIYELLKQYEKLGYRNFDLLELRKYLDLATKYNRYYDFKIKVLEQATKDINNKTDITISYQEFRKDKNVTSIKFYIKSKKEPKKEQVTDQQKAIDKDNQIHIDDIKQQEQDQDQDQLIKQVRLFLSEKLADKSILSILAVANNDIDLIKDKYILSKNYDIKNLTAWLIKAIKDDFKQVAGAEAGTTNQANKSKSNNKFNNYEQRDYNFDELEKKSQEKLINKQYKIN